MNKHDSVGTAIGGNPHSMALSGGYCAKGKGDVGGGGVLGGRRARGMWKNYYLLDNFPWRRAGGKMRKEWSVWLL